MTNQSSDTQPALRPLNVLVRAGRLTKFKGQVASIAPGLSVVATAAVLFTGSAAQAANECGSPTNGVVTCAADADTSTPVVDPYDDGITYTGSNNLTLELNDPDITVNGSGVRVAGPGGDGISVQLLRGKVITKDKLAWGLYAQILDKASQAVVMAEVAEGGEIKTDGAGAHGLLADTSGFGNATAEVSGGKVTTTHVSTVSTEFTYGLWATIKNNESEATAMAQVINGGEVSTASNHGFGLYAHTKSDKDNAKAVAQLDGASKVTTTGSTSHGLHATNEVGRDASNNFITTESHADMEVSVIDGTIETSGNYASAAYANNIGLGASLAKMDGGTIITKGLTARGLFAAINNTTSTAEVKAHMMERDGKTSTITTEGEFAHGVFAIHEGDGEAVAQMDGGSVLAKGRGSRGVYALADNTGEDNAATARMNGGHVETEGNGADGVYAQVNGTRDATVEMRGGTVITRGTEHVDAANPEKNDRASYGLFAFVNDTGSNATAKTVMTGEADVKTYGGKAHGVVASTTGSGAAIAQMMGGGVTTYEESAYGLVAQSARGQAVVDLGANAVVTVYGAGSDGIRADGATGFDVDVDGVVTGGSGNGAAIRTTSSAGGTIDITRTAVVTAGRSDLAIVDGDGDADITLAGIVTGDINTGAGDDSVTIESTARYDFSYILDGGTGDDELTLHGQTMTSMENFRNWESVTLSETTLRLDGAARLDMGLSINPGSVFRASGGEGGIAIAGDVTNRGTLVLNVQDGDTDDVITIEGDYTGPGSSVVALDTILDSGGPGSDRLVITGDTSGQTMLSLAGVDSSGAEVTELEIDVVSVGGQSDGTFTLMDGNHVTSDGEQAVIAGAYLYTLAETGRGWALSARSEAGEPVYQPSAPIYDSYGQSLLALNGPASLRSRGSSEDFRSLAWDGGPATQSAGSPLWFRMGTEQVTLAEEHSTTGAALDSSVWEIEIGGDVVLSESGAGLLVGGLQFSYATGSASVTSEFGGGSIDTTGLGLGLAATWYDNRRFYVDGQFTFASYTSDLDADRIGTLADGNGGTGYALSIEAGQQLDLGARLTVIPQAQLSLSSVAFDDFEGERYGEQVTLEDASSQQLRLGLEFGAQEAQETRRLYGIVNLFHEFGAGSEVNVAGATLTTESEPWAVGVGFGGNYALTDRVDLFGEASYATGLSNAGDTSALSANAGLKVVF